jgi:hypothetical protein
VKKRGLRAPIYHDKFILSLIDAGYAAERAAYIVHATHVHEIMFAALTRIASRHGIAGDIARETITKIGGK